MTGITSDHILQRMMALHPKIIDLTLDRVWHLLEKLGHPERALPPVIHVAGTNGKGSTLAMIRAGLEGDGMRVHAYTSPHLVRFHERIRIGGEFITEDALTALLDEVHAANGSDPITYFEITTCAALLAFSREPADYVLLEVGLGGRLDATNVIERPAATAITPVALDHQQYLGETLAEIAGEKAGILKPGVTCAVGPQTAEAEEVIEARAARVGAPLQSHRQHWHCYAEHERLVFQDETGLLDLPMPALPGLHQIDNAGTALSVLRHLGAGEAACEAAMTRAEWPARFQRLRRGPLAEAAPGAELWLDGGHNPAAGEAIARHLAALPKRPTFLVCGMLNTKDVAGFLAPFAGLAERLIAIPVPDEKSTLPAEATATAAERAGLPARTAATALDAVGDIARASPHARILFCGSLYLAGAILRENG